MDNQSDYEKEEKTNKDKFMELLRAFRPDVFILLVALDETGVNFEIPRKIIYQLEKIAKGSKYGKVNVVVENGIATFVYGEEANKLSVPVLKP